LHYKMEMDKLDGALVIMIYLMLQCMVHHHVDQLEVHGVTMSGKIWNINKLWYKLM